MRGLCSLPPWCLGPATLAVAGLMLVGCSKGREQGATNSQIIAHIGKEVVTTQELQNEFRWENVPVEKQKDPDALRKVLGDLVLRKYLFQRAVNSKLDREPGVLLDVLRSREQVLANAFLTRKAGSTSPSKGDIDNYIATHPSKFADRKIFNIEQITFRSGAESQRIIDASKTAKSLDEVDQQLTSAGIAHDRQFGVLSSSDLPQELLEKIEANKAQEVFFVSAGQNGVFFKIKDEEVRPLEGEAAAELAQRLIRADALRAETVLAGISANQEATFEGDYAKIMANSVSSDGKR